MFNATLKFLHDDNYDNYSVIIISRFFLWNRQTNHIAQFWSYLDGRSTYLVFLDNLPFSLQMTNYLSLMLDESTVRDQWLWLNVQHQISQIYFFSLKDLSSDRDPLILTLMLSLLSYANNQMFHNIISFNK
jgi:hypothetical protein